MNELASTSSPGGFLGRWKTYFEERFPLLRHGILIAAFCFGVLGYAARACAPAQPLQWVAFPVAFAITFLALLQLRVLDEFKDAEDDRRWRPYRPVPRGLVSLPELRVLWFAAAGLQILAALLVDARLLYGLISIWGYSALMTVEFFCPQWLKRHPLVYMLSHILIVPVITAEVVAVHGMPAHATPDGIWPLLATTYCAFCVIEIGRKLRSPGEEQPGVETYTAVWGAPRAVFAWLAFMAAATLFAVLSASRIGPAAWVAACTGVAFAAAVFVGLRFLRDVQPHARRQFNFVSGLWALVAFVSLGASALYG